MAKKISDRAAMLLALIIDHTRHDGTTGQRISFWVPKYGEQRCPTLGGYVWVSGSGDAAALRALEGRGFIKKEALGAYSASATEDGILHFERQIRETGRVEDLKRIVAKNEAVMRGPQDDDETEAAQ